MFHLARISKDVRRNFSDGRTICSSPESQSGLVFVKKANSGEKNLKLILA